MWWILQHNSRSMFRGAGVPRINTITKTLQLAMIVTLQLSMTATLQSAMTATSLLDGHDGRFFLCWRWRPLLRQLCRPVLFWPWWPPRGAWSLSTRTPCRRPPWTWSTQPAWGRWVFEWVCSNIIKSNLI